MIDVDSGWCRGIGGSRWRSINFEVVGDRSRASNMPPTTLVHLRVTTPLLRHPSTLTLRWSTNPRPGFLLSGKRPCFYE